MLLLLFVVAEDLMRFVGNQMETNQMMKNLVLMK
jgi:hypothetical protein